MSLLGIERRLQDEGDHEAMGPVQFFKYAIDWNGQFKIFRYCDD